MYTLTISGYTYRVGPDVVSASMITILPDNYDVNTVYKVSVMAGLSGLYNSGTYILEQDHNFWFTSQYCPLFSTPSKVRLTAGPGIEMISDDSIYRMINKNSMDAVDLWNTCRDRHYPYDHFGCTWETVPFVIRRFVEAKTAYDIISLIKLSMTMEGIGPNQLKTLGDMTISYRMYYNNLEPNKLKELYDTWHEALRMFKDLDSTVKSIHDSSLHFRHPSKEPRHNRIVRPIQRAGMGYYPEGYGEGYGYTGYPVYMQTDFFTPGTFPSRGFL